MTETIQSKAAITEESITISGIDVMETIQAENILTPAEMIQESIRLAKNNRKSEAKELLLRAVELEPDSEIGWLWLAGVTESPEEQIPHLEKVLSLKPGHKGATEGLKRALTQSGINSFKQEEKANSRNYFEKLLKIDPRNELGLHWMATLAEQPYESVYFLEKVLAINPSHERVLRQINPMRMEAAKRAIEAGKPEQAKQYLDNVLEVMPKSDEAWYLLSKTVTSAQEAIPLLQKALELNPKNEAVITALATWNNNVSAITTHSALTCPICTYVMQEGLGKCRNCRCYIDWMNVEAIVNNTGVDEQILNAAIADYQGMLQIQPAPLTTFFLTIALLNAHKVEEAVSTVREAIRTWPKSEEFAGLLQQMLKIRSKRSWEVQEQVTESAINILPMVLVIDDSPTVRKVISSTFEKDGTMRVLAAESGYEAFRLIRANNIPDLILLDVMMPGADGYDVMKLLKNNPQTKPIPVVMLTGKGGIINKMKGKFAGATAYLTKPINTDELLETVKKILLIPV